MNNITKFIRRLFLNDFVKSSPITNSQKIIDKQSVSWIPKSAKTLDFNLQPKMATTGKSITLEEAQKDREHLEKKVFELVDKLESKKKLNEIKVPKEAIIKSKEEREASAALEKLAIKEEKQAKPTETPAGDNSATTARGKKSDKTKGKATLKEPAVEKPLDASRLDLRIGKIVEVDRHPDADALYVEKIECGDPTGPRTVISGLVKHVPIDEMKDRLVVVLCNLKPAKMRGILSEAMVMCASTPEKVELIKPPSDAKPGDRVVFDKYPGEPDAQLNPKKKIWEQVSTDIKTNDEGVAMYKECEFKILNSDGKFTSSLKNVLIK